MFREMRYVYEVYRERSFSRAAQKLYISQPSLSLMIKKAEERVGSPLFDRSTEHLFGATLLLYTTFSHFSIGILHNSDSAFLCKKTTV